MKKIGDLVPKEILGEPMALDLKGFTEWHSVVLTDFWPIGEYGWPEFYMLDCCSFSDLSGSVVSRANYKVLKNILSARFFRKGNWKTYYGDHGTRGIAISVDFDDPEICAMLAGLADYPALDDDVVSRIERELIVEAWEDWRCAEMSYLFDDALETQLGIRLDEIPTDTVLEALAYVAAYPQVEDNGCGVYFPRINPQGFLEALLARVATEKSKD